jgi:tripartite-type tricarboxylate transporter receptor subunit TctC
MAQGTLVRVKPQANAALRRSGSIHVERSALRLIPSACAVSLVILGLASEASEAKDFPDKSIRFIVPWPPGGGADFLSRVIAQKLTERYGQNVVVDNRGGAGGVIGTEMAATAPADGYTWLLETTPTTIAPALYTKLGFDVVKNFTPVSLIASAPYVLASHPSLPVTSVAELIAYSKAHPGQLSYSSSGNGSVPHLAGALLNTRAGLHITHIPYRGTAPAIADTLSGSVQFTIANLVPMLTQIHARKLRGLAVTSLDRANVLPDLPTIAESGFQGFEASVWYGIAVPAGTPRSLVDAMNSDINQVIRSPDVAPRLSQEGATAQTVTPEQFAAYVQSELKKWNEAVRISGARVD